MIHGRFIKTSDSVLFTSVFSGNNSNRCCVLDFSEKTDGYQYKFIMLNLTLCNKRNFLKESLNYLEYSH